VFNDSEPATRVTFNQTPLAAPSVFGFFPWDHQPDEILGEGTEAIDYVYPEAYLYNWSNVVVISNKLWGNFIKKEADVPRFMDALLASADNGEFVDYVLDQVLFGNYRPVLREQMLALVDARGANELNGKLRDALALATSCPDFLQNNVPQEV